MSFPNMKGAYVVFSFDEANSFILFQTVDIPTVEFNPDFSPQIVIC